MPSADLPTSALGWIIALGAGVVGFIAGFLFISLAERMIGHG